MKAIVLLQACFVRNLVMASRSTNRGRKRLARVSRLAVAVSENSRVIQKFAQAVPWIVLIRQFYWFDGQESLLDQLAK
jgi:hypothetical protein